MKNIEDIGIQIPSVLLPETGTDFSKWAVIACDQFTSEPEYWQNVSNYVGNSFSTLNLILPELYLGKPDENARIQQIQQSMKEYLDKGILKSHDGLILVERKLEKKVRYGVMLALDLEKYDFHSGSHSLIRATEQTIIDRLPPRIRIRQDAPLEIPHIIVLIDDPQNTVIEPIIESRNKLGKVYDFDLMLDSGHLNGYLVQDEAIENNFVQALRRLGNKEEFQQKYSLGPEKEVLLLAVGDGNHSLAAAKSIWEKIKSTVGLNHPARYALVEVENIHNPGLEFKPIHRVLFGVKASYFKAMKEYFGENVTYIKCNSREQMFALVENCPVNAHRVGVSGNQEVGVITIANPSAVIAAATIQTFLDLWQKKGGFEKIDYIHGDEVVSQLSARESNLGFFLPEIKKSDLFKTVISEGTLPRKAFSMGEAKEKRFYMESRYIS